MRCTRVESGKQTYWSQTLRNWSRWTHLKSTSTLIPDRPDRGKEQRNHQGESDGSSSTPLRDSSWYDGEARNDFWSISGNFIYRHHVERRVKLYMPRSESCPIQLKYSGRVRGNSSHSETQTSTHNLHISTAYVPECETEIRSQPGSQKKGLQFYKTRSNAIVPHNTFPCDMHRESGIHEVWRRIAQQSVSISKVTAKYRTQAKFASWTPGSFQSRSQNIRRPSKQRERGVR